MFTLKQPSDPRSNKRALRYLFITAALMVGLYAVVFADHDPDGTAGQLLTAYLNSIASSSAWCLRLLGENVRQIGATVSGRFAYVVVIDCAALDAQCLYVAAICAFPAAIWKRALGVVVGVAAIFVINTMRLVALYFAGARSYELFARLHEEVFVFVVIALVVGLFAAWSMWALSPSRVQTDVAARA